MRTIFTIAISFFTAVSLFAEVVAPNGAKQLDYRTSWLGNTYGGLNSDSNAGQGSKGQWVQQDIAAMQVTPDGTVYTNVPWEEAGGNCMMYKDGKMLGAAMHTHGWGFNGGKAVAVNDKYVFIALMGNNESGGLNDAGTWPPKGFDWYGISRRLRSDFTKGAQFEHGKGGKGDTLPKSFLVINEVSVGGGIGGPGAITGLWAANDRLYVSNPLKNRVEIYDAETMLKLSDWDLTSHGFTEPGQIAADKNGNIWVYHLETVEGKFPHPLRRSPTISQFDPNGKKLKGRISEEWHHSAIGPFCFGPDNKMYVFNGNFILSLPWQEEDNCFVLSPEIFGGSDDKHSVKLIGYAYMEPRRWGEFCDLRFHNRTSVKAIGCDAAGNLYIAQDLSTNGGGAVLESYKLTGKEKEVPASEQHDYVLRFLDAELRWRLFGLCFIDCATLDPDNETIAYTKDKIFKLDWSQTEPGKEWSFIGTTTMPIHLGHLDSRFDVKDSAGVWVRSNLGHSFLFVSDMNSQWMQVFDLSQSVKIGGRTVETMAYLYAFFAGKRPNFSRETYNTNDYNKPWEDGEFIFGNRFSTNHPGKNEPAAQGWWVDSDCNVWRASETQGIRRFAYTLNGWTFENMLTFPHPAEFRQVKRIRYYPETDTLYLGGCAAVDGVEHKNQHWKPMGPVIARYDNFLKGDNPGSTEGKLRWRTVMPYVAGSSGHESCEPMCFDIAGDYMFVPYTGSSKTNGIKHGRVEVIRTADASPVGWMEPDSKTVGEIGLQDIRECISAHQLKSGEYVIFLEDDYKAKVVIYRWKPR